MKQNYKQIYAIRNENKRRILSVCPDCPERSGIYFLLREENGFKFGYIGKAKNLLGRLADHLNGRQQHIDRSIKKHGLWSEVNQNGYKVHFLEFPEIELDEKEQFYIRKYANAGYQLRNVESGGNAGKGFINEKKPAKGYYDGYEAGKKKLAKEIKHIVDLHLDISLKKETKISQKALAKFYVLINQNEKGEKQ
jgi:hypothetical protein